MTATASPRPMVAPTTASVPVVELRDLFCVHRTAEGDAAALQGAILTVAQGEHVCVIGPSGAGKSTLLQVIAGLQLPSAGMVRVLGHDMGRLRSRARAKLRQEALGFLTQRADQALPPALSIQDIVALPLVVRGVRRSHRRARVANLLEAAGLAERSAALPGELSGGERQRVALCASLAHRPALLLADEPTGELDPAAAKTMRSLIAELCRAERATAIVVSHDPESASAADRIIQLRDGRVVEEQRPGEESLLVVGGGWLQLPQALAETAQIGEHARVSVADGGLLVSAAGGRRIPASPIRASPVGCPTWNPVALELRSVRRVLGSGAARREVISDCDLAVAPGRLTAITGRSGAGKTTLLRLLAGFEKPDSGEVLIDSVPVTPLDPEQLAALCRRQLGFLSQEPSPIPFLSATENVRLGLALRGFRQGEVAERAAMALARVGLSDRAQQRVARLSAGEAQRVALARALAAARGLLIVDEPTSRLDRAGAAIVARLLEAAVADDRQTVVCATHDPALIKVADAVIELEG